MVDGLFYRHQGRKGPRLLVMWIERTSSAFDRKVLMLARFLIFGGFYGKSKENEQESI